MKLNELKESLETLNIPVAYNFFKEEQILPYIVILSDGEESGGSDYGNELIRRVFIIELYSVQKDEALEDKLEKLLDEPKLLRTPIVRNGRQATVGYCPEVWKTWEA